MASSVLTYLDGYCERAGHVGAFAEPLNLITNLFFILAALLAAQALMDSKSSRSRLDLWLLVVMLFAIGVGSGLWHLVPTKHTLLMDVIPITLFINIYLIAALRHLFSLSWAKVVLWWGTYLAASVAAQMTLPPELLNGTIMYIPTYVTLGIMTAALWRRDERVGRVFLTALLVWSLSLTFRTIDVGLCRALPIGTHFLWHTLNAWMLWRLLMVLMVQPASRKSKK